MLYDDDDELDTPALSGARQLERSDHRKQERREMKERKEKLTKTSATRLLLGALRSIVGFVLPKNGKQDHAPKTMTHREEEQQRLQRADTKPSPDQLLTNAQEQEKAEQAAQYEEESGSVG